METQLLVLHRIKPRPDGITGIVADAAIFPNGRAVLQWRLGDNNLEIYSSEQAMRDIREHSGYSQFRPA